MTTVQELRTLTALERLPKVLDMRMEEMQKTLDSIAFNLALVAGELQKSNDRAKEKE